MFRKISKQLSSAAKDEMEAHKRDSIKLFKEYDEYRIKAIG